MFNIKVGSASIVFKEDTLSAEVNIPVYKIHLNFGHGLETGNYYENGEFMRLPLGTQDPLISYKELLKSLDKSNLDSLNLEYLLRLEGNLKRLEVICKKRITEDLVELEIKSDEGGIGVEIIKTLTFLYSQKQKKVIEVYAIRPGFLNPDITGILEQPTTINFKR